MSVELTSLWAVRLGRDEAEQLGSLRPVPGLSVLVDGATVWLRGETIDSTITRLVRSIPNAEWFDICPDDQIARLGEIVPHGRLPQGEWRPLAEWIELKLPIAGFAAASIGRAALKVVRSTSPSNANLLRTTAEVWRDFAATAPQVRLNRLAFAVSDTQSVLIRGTPLPPIPGQRFIESRNLDASTESSSLSGSYSVAVPSGWRFDPPLSPKLLGELLKLVDFEMALFSEDGTYERVPDTAFVQASRSAVRMTHG